MDKEHNNRINKIDSSSSGFKIPDDYFDNLENILAQKILTIELSEKKKKKKKSLNKLHIIRPNELKTKRTNTGFKVPENYFELFETRIDQPKEFNTNKRKVHRLRIFSMSVAASILLFFGIQFMNKGQQSVNQVILENEEIAGWIDEDLITFDTYDIAEAFSDVEIEQTLYAEEAMNDYLDFIDIETLIIEY